MQRVQYGVYLVPSASREGLTPVVTGTRVDGADLSCDCEAGSLGKPCWPAAAVMVAKMEHTAGVRIVDPAPKPVAPTAPAVEVPKPVRMAPRRVELL